MWMLPISCDGDIMNPKGDAPETSQPSDATLPPQGFILIGPGDPDLQPGQILAPGTVLWP